MHSASRVDNLILMFDFLRRGKTCCECGLGKKNAHLIGFDPSNRGENVGAMGREYFCPEHLKNRWRNEMEKFQGYAVCYLPSDGWNSYSYITFDRAEEWAVEQEETEIMRTIVEKFAGMHTCQRCAKQARFFVMPYPFDVKRIIASIEKLDMQQPEMLCSDHFIDRIIDEITNKSLKIDEIGPAFGEQGFYMHGSF